MIAIAQKNEAGVIGGITYPREDPQDPYRSTCWRWERGDHRRLVAVIWEVGFSERSLRDCRSQERESSITALQGMKSRRDTRSGVDGGLDLVTSEVGREGKKKINAGLHLLTTLFFFFKVGGCGSPPSPYGLSRLNPSE